jgi:hypothetical protein
MKNYLNEESKSIVKLLGGVNYQNVYLTKSQDNALKKAYKFKSVEDKLQLAAAQRNLCQEVNNDAIRIMALIAPCLEPGEDPCEFLSEVLNEAGFGVDPVGTNDNEYY